MSRIDYFTLSDDDFRHFTRFSSGDLVQVWLSYLKGEIEIKFDFQIAALLEIPACFQTPSGVPFTREEGLFLLCARPAWATRLGTLEFMFGYHYTSISQYTNLILDTNWDFLLRDFESGHLGPDRLAEFARKVHSKGAPLDKCWGFIDCTIRQICSPSRWQRDCYNGYKHMHALKYSAVKCPDGLIYQLHGPWEDRRNDNALLHDSGVLERCHRYADGHYMYGDPAYRLSSVLLCPYSHLAAELYREQRIFNECMSSCREAVEWGFAGVLNYGRLWTLNLHKDYLVPQLSHNIE